MSKNDGGSAFPRPHSEKQTSSNTVSRHAAQEGMTLRDWFAGQALGATDWDANGGNSISELAARCYEIADVMIAERKVGD